MVTIGFIGAGTVGTALAVHFKQKNYPITAVSSRSPASAKRFSQFIPNCHICPTNQEVVNKADLVFLTIPDDAIKETVASLAWSPHKMVVHTSGAASLDVLEPAKRAGALVGSFHPLQTFASIPQAIDNLPGSFFAIESTGRLKEILIEMARSLDGQWIELKGGQKELYHLSAVLACNYWVTLVDIACSLWKNFNLPKEKALTALLPLLQGTLNNLQNVGLPHALTGPIARGDMSTVEKHLKAIKNFAPQLLTLYKELGKFTIPIGEKKGTLSPEKAKQINKLLGGE